MDASAPTTSLEVRTRLVEALKLALVGPWAGHALAEERLPGWERPLHRIQRPHFRHSKRAARYTRVSGVSRTACHAWKDCSARFTMS